MLRCFGILFFSLLLLVGFYGREVYGEEKSGDSELPAEGRFSVYEDGTVLDLKTSLMWLKNANEGGYPLPLSLAKQYVRDMNGNRHQNFGYADWRLPSIGEIETLLDASNTYPALPAEHPFEQVRNHFYWSSSIGRDITDYAWVLDMSSGRKTTAQISNCTFLYFWPVRNSRDSKASKSGIVTATGMFEAGGGAPPDLTDVVKVASGVGHALALKSDGTVWAWGENSDGRLGDGTLIDRSLPVFVGGIQGVIDIAAGMYHSVALKSDGSVWAWGRNSFGQLGDGTTANSMKPVRVKKLPPVEKIFAGYYNTFATGRKTLWGWGGNAYGQLGDGSKTDRLTPVEIKGFDASKVAAGLYHTVALKSDGSVWAWGWNMFGFLGDGTSEDRLLPVSVKGLSDVTDIAAGLYHSLALKSDGSVWAWGKNEYSQLGISSSGSNTVVMVENLSGARAVAAGAYHSVAVMEDGTVRVWGKDSKERKERQYPAEVEELAGAFYVSAGKHFTIAIKN